MEVNAVGQEQVASYSNNIQATNELEKADFLQLLTAQLKYQNPLAPVDNFDFMSQTAQFNLLEQVVGLNEKFESLTNLNDFSYANNLIGRTVKGNDREGEFFEGIVEKVEIEEGRPYLLVEGKKIACDCINSIEQEEEAAEEVIEEN